jgi:hypothetical protein
MCSVVIGSHSLIWSGDLSTVLCVCVCVCVCVCEREREREREREESKGERVKI